MIGSSVHRQRYLECLMMYLWVIYVVTASIVYASCNDVLFSIVAAMFLLLLLWPLALPLMFIGEVFKAVTKK